MSKFPVVQFLPTHCWACGRVALAPRDPADTIALSCVHCGGAAVVVPGPSFATHEQAAFAELSSAARGAHLRPAEAQRITLDIERALAQGEQWATLERLSVRLPRLSPLLPALVGSPARQARALRMLETILNALMTTQRSGTVSVVPQPHEAFGGSLKRGG
jgi:hypothetical protein